MEQKPIAPLPVETTRLISSCQVITSVSSVVKELFENSLDAGAKNISIKLDNFGLSCIEIKDDGDGISYNNVQKMFLPGYTSKIVKFQDLDQLTSYGFRGEALSAICRVGDTTLVTKTDTDAIAMSYTIGCDGSPLSSTPSHLPRGTMIQVKNLFHSLPVRKQFMSSKKKMADELKKVEGVVQALSVVHPTLRVALSHNKCNIWQKNAVVNIKQCFMQVVGLKVAAKMDLVEETRGEISMSIILPKKGGENVDGIFMASSSYSFIFINKRPVTYKEIAKEMNEHIFFHYKETDSSRKQAAFLLSLTVPPSEIDVNLEPNKTRVLLKNMEEVISMLRDVLEAYYGHRLKSTEPEETPKKRIKLDEDNLTESAENIETNRRSWTLEIINDDAEAGENIFSSQINKNNCTLASNSEISALSLLTNCNGSRIATIAKSSNLIGDHSTNQQPIGNPEPERCANAFDGAMKVGTAVRDSLVDDSRIIQQPIRNQILETDDSRIIQQPIRNQILGTDDSRIIQQPIRNQILETDNSINFTANQQHGEKEGHLWTLDDWSRGKVQLLDGKTLQPGATVVSAKNAVDQNWKGNSIEKSNVSINSSSCYGQTTIEDDSRIIDGNWSLDPYKIGSHSSDIQSAVFSRCTVGENSENAVSLGDAGYKNIDQPWLNQQNHTADWCQDEIMPERSKAQNNESVLASNTLFDKTAGSSKKTMDNTAFDTSTRIQSNLSSWYDDSAHKTQGSTSTNLFNTSSSATRQSTLTDWRADFGEKSQVNRSVFDTSATELSSLPGGNNPVAIERDTSSAGTIRKKQRSLWRTRTDITEKSQVNRSIFDASAIELCSLPGGSNHVAIERDTSSAATNRREQNTLWRSDLTERPQVNHSETSTTELRSLPGRNSNVGLEPNNTSADTNKIQQNILSFRDDTPNVSSSRPTSLASANVKKQGSLADWARKDVQGTLDAWTEATKNKEDVAAAKRFTDDVDAFDLSLRSVSSQMGVKELTGFTKFARIMRPKIIAENPSLLFTEVSHILVERWRGLVPDEQEYYNSVAEAVSEKRKIYDEQKKSEEQNTRTRNKPRGAKRPLQIARPKRNIQTFTVSLESIKKSRQNTIDEDRLSLIGQIKPCNSWLYRSKDEIGYLRHVCLQETVLYNKMLESYTVESKTLATPEFISEETLGFATWSSIATFSTTYNKVSKRHEVDSPFVIKNGFNVELVKADDGSLIAGYITRVPAVENISPLRGFADLTNLYETEGSSAGLERLRTTEIKQYLRDRAAERAKTSDDPMLRDYLEQILSTWQQRFTTAQGNCLHSKQLFAPIYSF